MNDWNRHLTSWDQAAWTLAAAALTIDDRGAPATREAAAGLLGALEASDLGTPALDPVQSRGIAARATSSLLQAAAVLTGDDSGWARMPDDILLAQGHASAHTAGAFAQGISRLPTMADRLEQETACMLDVGVGVAALAVAVCKVFPTLTVVGIDVLPRALTLAEGLVAHSTVADRVLLREQSFADISDLSRYDLAWVPAPFIPTEALAAGTSLLLQAMRPGGWVVLGHAKVSGDALEDALTRFKTVAYGGTMLDNDHAEDLLNDAGFESVGHIPTPAGAPAITVGQAPARRVRVAAAE